MEQPVLPAPMSLPEVMGDPCAGPLREHAVALLRATASAAKLVRAHPEVESDLVELRETVERHASAVLEKLASRAGIPIEGGSISAHQTPFGDYRIDRSSGCWIWMRSTTARGYPIAGRKANGRENVPAKIYWMLARGPIGEHEIVVRTCNSRLCINPDHGRLTDRRDHGAECMRQGSTLDWAAVREIRHELCQSGENLHGRARTLADRFGVGEYSVLDVFRNKVWFDPAYEPGFEVACAGPGCGVAFRTTSTVRKYHSRECCSAALGIRAVATRSRVAHWAQSMSPERRAREAAALHAETAAAEAEWSELTQRAPRTSVWTVASMDQPVGDGGGQLGDLLASGQETDDPAIQLERGQMTEALDGLTEEDVADMNEEELAAVRARLIAADVYPSISRAIDP